MTKRVYVWTHNWLSPIQKGIQGAHAVVELSRSCCSKPKGKACLAYQGWSLHHKTLVFFNGGNSAALLELEEFLRGSEKGENDTHWADFREDQESLEGAMTAVAVLPTENICDAVDYCREMGLKDCRMLGPLGPNFNLTGWEIGLVNMIIGSRMAS